MGLSFITISNLPAFRVLEFEIIFTALVCVMEYKSGKKPDIAFYLKGIRNLLILFMPIVAFVEFLYELHVPAYLSVLSWIVVIACWFSYQLYQSIKAQKQIKHFIGIFIGIEVSTIVMHFILYSSSQ